MLLTLVKMSATKAQSNHKGVPRLPFRGIAMGRGGKANNHGGNDEFRSIVGEYKMDYICKDKNVKKRCEKIAIRKQVIKHIHANGLTFMERRTDKLWYPVTLTKKINRKVAQALREKAPQIIKELVRKELVDDCPYDDDIVDLGTRPSTMQPFAPEDVLGETKSVVSVGSSVASAQEETDSVIDGILDTFEPMFDDFDFDCGDFPQLAMKLPPALVEVKYIEQDFL